MHDPVVTPIEGEKTPRWLLSELHTDLFIQLQQINSQATTLLDSFDKLSTGENPVLAALNTFDVKAKSIAAYLNETVKLSDAKLNDGAKQFESSLSSTIMRYADLTAKIAQQSVAPASKNNKTTYAYLFTGIFIGLLVSLLIYVIFK